MTEKEYDIQKAFKEIEDELLEDLSKRLAKGIKEDASRENYKLWQVEQLEALQQYRYIDNKKFKKRYIQLNKKIRKMIEETGRDTRLKETNKILRTITGEGKKPVKDDEVILLDEKKLNVLVDEAMNGIETAEMATLRMMDDQYRKIVFNTQVQLNTGSITLRGAIDKATRNFYEAGIRSVQYKNGNMVDISSYSEMALRTANKRAALQGAAIARDEYDLHLVVINKRGVACPLCEKYRGRVCIDDVFGGGKPDGKHPLLSEFMKGGLYHPNCKDTHTTYFEGISEASPGPTKEEQEEAYRIYQLEQQQRYNERQIRKYKRLEEYQLDPTNKEKAKRKRLEWQQRQREFVDAHEELRRKYDREKIII